VTPRVALIAFLALAVLVSAVSVVYVKQRSRVLFVELRALERERDRLHIEWSQLAIERSVWGTHDRVEGLARAKLNFVEPNRENTRVVAQR
jgi:cell division protein FtsL